MKTSDASDLSNRTPAGIDWPLAGLISALGVILIALVVLTDGNIAVIAAPLLLIGVLVLMWRLPLRYSVFVLLFLDITMEAPYEGFASYHFRTPFFPLGTALLGHLNMLTGIKALNFSGTDLVVLYLFVIVVYRRATRSRIDGPIVPSARAMIWAGAFSMLVAGFIWTRGLSSGGDFQNSLWQVQKFLYIPLFFFLFQAGMRGAADQGTLARLFVWAGLYRALLAVYIYFAIRPHGKPLAYCTSHADTILFVDVLALMVVLWNEKVQRKRRWLYGIVMAIIVAGIVVNGRRIAWVTFTGGLLAIASISPWTTLKRRVARSLLVVAPLIAVYLSAGWNSHAAIFAPAQTVRSVVDSKSDSSSEWRDMENQNLITNIGMHPWFGVGYGHEYIEFNRLPDVSSVYPQFRYIPHNSVLGSLVFAGAFGFTGLWTMLVVLVFLAARSYHRTAVPAERAAAMMCIVAVIAYMNEVYGDIGVSLWLGPLTLAPAMVVAAKLATSTGAWPLAKERIGPQQPVEMPSRVTIVPLEPAPLGLNEPGTSS